MSDDQYLIYLIDRARQVIEGNMKLTLTIPQHEGEALLRRIRQLESACYRLTEERDRLKSWADRDSDELEKLRARLATAEADALERAARVLSRASDEIRSLKPKADE